MITGIVGAFRDAGRQLRRDPLPAFFIALTMAIGIAAAAAIFTVARGVVLRPLPYDDAKSLVAIQEYQPGQAKDQTAVASANVARYAAARGLARVSAFSYSEFVLSGDTDAERIIGAGADADLFPTLGVRPLLGRGIEPGEVGDTPARVVVLAYELWRRRFGADRRLVGRSITIDGAPYTVIGVTADGFEFPRSAAMDRDVEAWVPRRPQPPMMARRGIRDLTVIARIRSGVNRVQAEQELLALSQQAEADNPQVNKGWRVRVVDLREIVVGRVRPTILMLAACVVVLLLIACVNASAAALARVTMRRQAFGVRLALGAGNRQLIGLVLAEIAVIAGVAALMALPMSAVLRSVLVQLAPVAIPRQRWIGVDSVTLLFTAVTTLVTASVTVIGPVSWLRRMDVREFLGEAARSTAGSRRRSRTLALFIVAQLALGTLLLAVTLTLYTTVIKLNRVDPGFVATDVSTATIPLRGMRYRDGATRSALTTQLLTKVRAIPGVERAAVGSLMPMSGGLMSGAYQVSNASSDSTAIAVLRAVSSDFFGTLGIAVTQGRAIEATDNASAVPVAVVNQAFVRQALGSTPALGRMIIVTPPGADGPQTFQIVGVVRDAKEKGLLEPDSPIVYFSDAQASFPHTVLAMRSRGAAPIPAIRAALRDLDPALALDDVGSLGSKVRSTYALQFFLMNILAAFALCALILIGVGVYGSVSYVVNADNRATGVRLALGATPERICSSLLGRTLAWSALGCAIGCAIGLVVSMVSTRQMGSTGLAAIVVGSLAGAVVMLGLALIATWHPAWRASHADPLTVLRA